jgi:MSHA biogenesis protein MshN
MSLINKMLQDLEQRHAEETASGLPQDVRATPVPQRSTPRWIMPLMLLAMLLCASLAWLWLRSSAEKQAPVAVTAAMHRAAPSPVAVAPAAVAPALSLTLKVDDDLSMKSIAQIPPPVADIAQSSPSSPAPVVPERIAADSASLVGSAGKEVSKPARGDAVPAKPHRDVPVQLQESPPAKAAIADQPLILNKQVKELTPQQKVENDYRRATTLIQQGRVQEAIALLEQVLQADASHVGARQTLIALMLNVKRRDDAMRLAQQGLELDQRQPNFAMILARLQLDKGDQKAAIATLQRSLPAASGNAEYQAFLAALLQREGRNAEAIDLYEAALDKAPQNGVWWMGLGISLQADKRLPQAREAFTHARDTGSLSPDLQAFVEQKIRQLAH